MSVMEAYNEYTTTAIRKMLYNYKHSRWDSIATSDLLTGCLLSQASGDELKNLYHSGFMSVDKQPILSG